MFDHPFQNGICFCSTYDLHPSILDELVQKSLSEQNFNSGLKCLIFESGDGNGIQTGWNMCLLSHHLVAAGHEQNQAEN
jgi:hypothetical protein